jgi:osmotically-inducible protein OsmY
MRNAGRLVGIGFVMLALAGCSPQQKEAANKAAQRAKTEAQKTLGSAEKALSDSSITLKVKTAMAASDKLKTSGINVDTKNRVVYLRGTVVSEDQKALAERIAKDTVGTNVRVVDQLQVHASAKRATKTP